MSTDAEIRSQIAERNSIRTEAKLPPLDGSEFAKLRAARDQKIFEGVFASEQARFSHRWRSRQDWFSGYGEWSKARKQVREELRMGRHIEHVLHELGYRLGQDAWDSHGRKTYLSDDDADKQFLKDLQTTLAEFGWVRNEHRLRCFHCVATGGFIELEPGRAESGHFLHHLKSE
jgi:hypothetical protein